MVGAAGRAASTKPHQPPLETIPVVVPATSGDAFGRRAMPLGPPFVPTNLTLGPMMCKEALDQVWQCLGLVGGSHDVPPRRLTPYVSCFSLAPFHNLLEGVNLSSRLRIGWTKTWFCVSGWALRHGAVKIGIWWSLFTMYIAILFLHSHSHHNLWKWLEISPMTMVYVIYITNLGIVDGLKWGVNDHQHSSLFTMPLNPRNDAKLDKSSGTRWLICKKVCPSW